MNCDNAFTRREFMHSGLSVVSTVAMVPLFLQQSGEAMATIIDDRVVSARHASVDQRILVVVQLSGGNDGLNAVVPFGIPAYYNARPGIAVKENEVLIVDRDRGVGLHPQLADIRAMIDQGNAGIIQAVGYPNPNRSHFASMDIWHAGCARRSHERSWMSKTIDHMAVNKYEAMEDLSGKSDQLANQLNMVASMIRTGLPTRIYYVTLGGFDTHANQVDAHGQQLQEFARSMRAFYRELEAIGEDRRVLTVAFSEFGRSVKQNDSNGTDHGAAGPMFIFGPMVNSGLIGEHPSLTELDDKGDLVYRIDFRSVYAGILDNWMMVDSQKVLGKSYKALNII